MSDAIDNETLVIGNDFKQMTCWAESCTWRDVEKPLCKADYVEHDEAGKCIHYDPTIN